jgi:hypothetical protein
VKRTPASSCSRIAARREPVGHAFVEICRAHHSLDAPEPHSLSYFVAHMS